MMTRRTVGLGAVGAAAAGLGARLFGSTSEAKDHHVYPVSHSDAEWKQQLTPEQYRVLRQHGTERAGTSPLNAEKRKGVFACAGCDQPGSFCSEAWKPSEPAQKSWKRSHLPK